MRTAAVDASRHDPKSERRIQTEVVGTSDAKSWARMYSILFPEDEVIPSPYSGDLPIDDAHQGQLSSDGAEKSHSDTDDPGDTESTPSRTRVSVDGEREHDFNEFLESICDTRYQCHNTAPVKQPPAAMGEARAIPLLSSGELLKAGKYSRNIQVSGRKMNLRGKITKFVHNWLLSLPEGHASLGKAVTEHPNNNTVCGQVDHTSPPLEDPSASDQPMRNLDRNSGKRKAPTDGNDNSDGDDEPSQGSGPGPGPGPKRDCRKFACPFVKMFPWLYSQKKRCQGGWPDVNRLKEHLYRQHIINEMCNRCGGAFDGVDELISHQRSDTPCEVQERQAGDGIDPGQLKQLKKKKRVVGSDYDKCRRIYTILWPEVNEGNLPCPYWDPPLLMSSNEPSASDYSSFLIQEFRPMMLERLETDIVAGNTPSAARVIDMMEGMLPALHERFRYQFNQGFMRQTYQRRRPLGAGSIPRAENAEQASVPVGATSTGNGSLRASDSPFQVDNLGLSTGPTNRSSGLTPRALGFDMDFTISQNIDPQVLYPNFDLDLEQFLREAVQSA